MLIFVWLSLVMLLMFAAMVVLFRKIMVKNVSSATHHLDELNQDYVLKEKEAERLLQEAQVKSQEMLTNAQAEAGQLKVDILKHAEEEKDAIIAHARAQGDEMILQADKSRMLLLSEMQQRIDKAAIDKASALLGAALPEEFKRQVHTRWVEDFLSSDFSHVAGLHIPHDVHEAKVVTAFALTDDQRKNIAKQLKNVLARDIQMQEDVQPDVVAGIVVTIGSLVLDGSLKNSIQQQAHKAQG
ncbi:MAG: F0F1 ATP synthase subunit delta [Candidatus Omnitrophica bacterium]|nr:F0F1 ATP synthase subunit delta [Candidatus Omnitrophota bacterium]